VKRLLLLTLLLLAVAAPVASAASCPKTSLLEIQDEVMCVICGVPLVNAGGPQSDDQRDFIRRRADRCESKEEIKAALVAEYGEAVLAVPQKSGFDLTAWLVPIAALLLALVAGLVGARRWARTKRVGEPETAGEGVTGELDRDLQRYDL
jgi:cytochrome c-type biogenesis protein CcmH/NrfF